LSFKKEILHTAKIFTVAATLFLGVQFIFAWSEPAGGPPGSNVSSPINTSGIDQIKTGGLSTGALVVTGGALIGSQIIGGLGAMTTAGTLNWNDVSNIRSGNGYTLLMGNAANGPGPGYYFHTLNFEYSSKNGSGNITQLAIPYGTPGGGGNIYMRGSYGGVWSAWSQVGSGAGLYLPLAGGVMNGGGTRIGINGSTITSGSAYGFGNGAAYNNPNSLAVDTLETDGGTGGSGTLELNYYGGGAVTIGPSGTKPLYASIMYDGNNTGYYVDPSNTSSLGSVISNSISTSYLDFRHSGGDSGQGANAYAIFQEGGAWTSPYPDLRIAYHTGIKLGANSSYNGIRFYNDYDMSGLVMSVNDASTGGANNVYIPNIAYIGDARVNILYDWQNTGYYVDPAGTSQLYAVTDYTRAAFNLPRSYTNRRDITSDSNYWTGTNGWGTGYGTWDSAWKWGFGGVDIWGTSTGHPQGAGYVHAQGIISGEHYATTDGSTAYGWMMVGAANATENRYWLRGKWGGSTSGWVEMITSGNVGSQSVNYANSAGSASQASYLNTTGLYYQGGGVGIGTAGPLATLSVGGAGEAGTGIYGYLSGGTGVHGVGTYGVSGTGGSYGVTGTGTYGVFGSGTYGIWGSGTSRGVTGSGPIGVYGQASGFGAIGVYGINSTVDSSGYAIYCYASGNVNGCAGTRAWTNVSDARLKKDVVTIPHALDTVMQLRGVNFNWKEGGQADTGFIAQEVLPYFPQVIGKDVSTGMYSMRTGSLTGLLAEAIKGLKIEKDGQIVDLQKQIDTQQKLIEELQQQIRELINK
jgi:hypothetical protein